MGKVEEKLFESNSSCFSVDEKIYNLREKTDMS